MNKIEQATKEFVKKDIPDFSSGDTISVEVKVKEGGEKSASEISGLEKLTITSAEGALSRII